MDLVWNNWFILSLLAPFFWSITNIIDLYFVGDKVYESELDGAAISGIFPVFICILIFLFIPQSVLNVSLNILFLSVLSGAIFAVSFYFYFKAYFIKTDAALIQIIWSLKLLIVPFIACILISEKLSLNNYIGIFSAFFGLLTLSYSEKQGKIGNFKNVVRIVLIGVFLTSLSMVLQKIVFQGIGFFEGLFYFCLGSFFVGIVLYFIREKRKKKNNRTLAQLIKKYFCIFILAESLALIGNLFMQKAIDVSDSPSFVALVTEGIQPIFIMLISLIVVNIFVNKKRKLNKLYLSQTDGWVYKIFASCLIVFGIWLAV